MDFVDEILSPSKDECNFYEILGCSEFSNTEQIITEYRIRARQYHPDKNLENSDTTQEFVKLQVAKDILTDPKKRKEYDSWRNSGLRISFKRWMSMQDTIKMSMHWATPVDKTPMIKSNQPCEDSKTPSGNDFSETLRRFRNYEI